MWSWRRRARRSRPHRRALNRLALLEAEVAELKRQFEEFRSRFE
jgi:hypothetical protein